MSPDYFLVHQYHLDPETVVDKLREQASVVRYDLGHLLEKLGKAAPTSAVLAAKPL